MLVDDVIARLDAPAGPSEAENLLQKRVKGAADLSDLIKKGALPPGLPAAYVIPLGLRDRGAEVVTGMFRQMLDDTVGVVLVARAAGDATGANAFPTIQTLIRFTINRIAGWQAPDAHDVFRVARGQFAGLSAGAVFWQLDFATQTQLRIAT